VQNDGRVCSASLNIDIEVVDSDQSTQLSSILKISASIMLGNFAVVSGTHPTQTRAPRAQICFRLVISKLDPFEPQP